MTRTCACWPLSPTGSSPGPAGKRPAGPPLGRRRIAADLRVPPGQEGVPLRHQLDAQLEQLCPPVGGLDVVANRVRQRRLQCLARVMGRLRTPIADELRNS